MFENYIAHSFERTSGLAAYMSDMESVNRFQADYESPLTQDLLKKQTGMVAVDIGQVLCCVAVGTAEVELQSLQYQVAYQHP
jgi:hypothetical protein